VLWWRRGKTRKNKGDRKAKSILILKFHRVQVYMDLLGLLLTLTTLPNLLLKPNLFLKLATIYWLGAGGAQGPGGGGYSGGPT
jgi:hypothetical protein